MSSKVMMLNKNFVETRRAPRHPSLPETNCFARSSDSGKFWYGWIVNISKTGIGLLLEERLDAGSILDLKLENKAQQLECSRRAEVKHSEICYPNEAWLHGCEFQEPLSDKELAGLCAISLDEREDR